MTDQTLDSVPGIICLSRGNGIAIYGRWVGGQYQTEVVRNTNIKPSPKLNGRSRIPLPVGLHKCPLCDEYWDFLDPNSARGPSRDHILKRAAGHSGMIHGDTRNIRFVCRGCNSLLERLGQCPGAVACWIAVTRREWTTGAARG